MTDIALARKISALVAERDNWDTFLNDFQTAIWFELKWQQEGDPKIRYAERAVDTDKFVFANLKTHVEQTVKAHIAALDEQINQLLKEKPESNE